MDGLMKVYLLEYGDYEPWVEGVYSSLESAVAKAIADNPEISSWRVFDTYQYSKVSGPLIRRALVSEFEVEP